MLQVLSKVILATLHGVYLHLLQRKKLRQGSGGYISCLKSYIHTSRLEQYGILRGRKRENERGREREKGGKKKRKKKSVQLVL